MISEKELNILIVEDEVEIANSISDYLSKLNFNCKNAFNLKSAIQLMHEKFYDFVILDMNLPDGYGIDFLKITHEINYKGNVIILSSQNSELDIIKGLNAGSDDYLVKPFNLAELAARIKNLMQWSNKEDDETISAGEIKINKREQKVFINGNLIHLTKSEFELLLFLVNNSNMVLTHYAISNHLYKNNNSIESINEVVYSHIKNLRKKISTFSNSIHITAVYGIGYKFLN